MVKETSLERVVREFESGARGRLCRRFSIVFGDIFSVVRINKKKELDLTKVRI